MKTRLLIKLEIEAASAEDVYDVAELALDAGSVQEAFEDTDGHGVPMKVTGASVSTLEDDLRSILWPGSDPEAEHGADTLATLAHRLAYLSPTAAEGEAERLHEPTPHRLTLEQQRAVVNCLRVAAQRFDDNARICREGRANAIATTFEEQAREARSLASLCDAATSCIFVTTGAAQPTS